MRVYVLLVMFVSIGLSLYAFEMPSLKASASLGPQIIGGSIGYQIMATAAENYDINQSVNQFNQFCDPQLNPDYQPIWTASTMSPCIDSGVGTDDDGTPADIGAIPAVPRCTGARRSA